MCAGKPQRGHVWLVPHGYEVRNPSKGLTTPIKVYILLIRKGRIHQQSIAQLARMNATCACSHGRKAERLVKALRDEALQPDWLAVSPAHPLGCMRFRGEVPVTQSIEVLVMDRTTLARNLKRCIRQDSSRLIHLKAMNSEALVYHARRL